MFLIVAVRQGEELYLRERGLDIGVVVDVLTELDNDFCVCFRLESGSMLLLQWHHCVIDYTSSQSEGPSKQ